MSAIFLATILAAASTGPDFGSLHVHKDWIVGCDNRRECHATSLPVEEDGPLSPAGDGNLSISIQRSGAPDAAPRVSIGILSEAVAARDKAQILSIRADGREVAISFRAIGGVINVTGRAAFHLAATMRDAESLALGGTDGREIASASLRGLKASLLYMDERQFRDGTVSALAKPGKKPANATTIPPMLPPPVALVSPEPPEPPVRLADDKIEALLETDPCRSGSGAVEKPSAEYARLDPETTLMLLPSYCMGYNAEVRVFVLDNNGNAKPAPFGRHPWNATDEDRADLFLPNGWWDRKRRILSGYGKGRGLGDCGQVLKFAWDTRHFRLVRYSSMSECRGSMDYITTYRLDVRIMPWLEVPTAPSPY